MLDHYTTGLHEKMLVDVLFNVLGSGVNLQRYEVDHRKNIDSCDDVIAGIPEVSAFQRILTWDDDHFERIKNIPGVS